MAEWLRRGLQILLSQFDSGRGLQSEYYFMIDKEIFKTASNNKDYGQLDNYSHYSNSKSSTCGDNIKIYIQVKNEKIVNLKYQGNFCIYCNASASLLAEKSKNKLVKETINFLKKSNTLFKSQKNLKIDKWSSFKKIMNKSNLSRKECLLLPLKTLLKALNN